MQHLSVPAHVLRDGVASRQSRDQGYGMRLSICQGGCAGVGCHIRSSPLPISAASSVCTAALPSHSGIGSKCWLSRPLRNYINYSYQSSNGERCSTIVFAFLRTLVTLPDGLVSAPKPVPVSPVPTVVTQVQFHRHRRVPGLRVIRLRHDHLRGLGVRHRCLLQLG